MASLTVGRDWPAAPGRPALEVGADVASGDSDPADGRAGRFDQLFLLGHAYFGHLDHVARQNVVAGRVQFTARPVPKLRLVAALHRFRLHASRDGLYSAAGAAVRRDETGAAGKAVATELDVLASWQLTRRQRLAGEVARASGGDFLRQTPGPHAATLGWLGWEMTS